MRSIRGRLGMGLALAVVAVLVAGSVALHHSVHGLLTLEIERSLLLRSKTLASLTKLEHGEIEIDYEEPKGAAGAATEWFQFWSADGRTLLRSSSLSADLPFRAGTLESPEYYEVALPEARRGLAASIVFPALPDPDEKKSVDASAAPLVRLVVAQDLGGMERLLAGLDSWLAIGGAALLAAAILLLAAVVRFGLRPLDRLGRDVSRVDEDSLAQRFGTAGVPSELLPILERLNEMLERLEAAFERERRFNAAVAHELRTPLAELRSTAEVALRWPEDARGSAVSMRNVLDTTLRLERIVHALRSLTRCAATRQPLQRSEVGLSEAVESAWRPEAESAAAKRISVAMRIPRDVSVETDPPIFASVLSNLISNAVEYTPEGGRIDCSVQETENEVVLTLTNSGARLEREDLPRLFEPFWRKDEARSDGGHSGLGLAVASSFAKLLGIRLEVELSASKDFVARLRIPRRAKSAPRAEAGERATA